MPVNRVSFSALRPGSWILDKKSPLTYSNFHSRKTKRESNFPPACFLQHTKQATFLVNLRTRLTSVSQTGHTYAYFRFCRLG